MDSRARRFSCPSSGNVVQRKKARVSLNDMSTEFDHRLSTGSLLRRVCLTCHTPLILSARKCKSCKSKLAIIWYRRVDTTGWRNPRKPPIYIPYPRNYAQCKYFLKGKECVNNPCHFAHGKDELEIWELYRSRGGIDRQKRQTSVLSLQKSRSCMSLSEGDTGTKFLSRAESLSSLRSLHSFSNPFSLLSGDEMQDEVGSDSEHPNLSQDVFDIDEPNVDILAGPSTSYFSLNIDTDVSPGEGAYQSYGQTAIPRTPVQSGNDDDVWTKVDKRQKVPSKKMSTRKRRGGRGERRRKKSNLSATVKSQDECKLSDVRSLSQSQPDLKRYNPGTQEGEAVKNLQQLNEKSTNFRPPPGEVDMGRYKLCQRFEKGRCGLRNTCTFAHGTGELVYWSTLYQHQAQLQKEPLLTKRFSEKIRRRIECEGEHHVLKEDIPGVTVNCNSPLEVKLDGADSPQNYVWTFDVRLEKKYVSLNQVAFLSEAHLDKFTFLRSQDQDHLSNMRGILLLDEDFVEVSGTSERAFQFCVRFSSGEFGDFEEKLVFDFGRGSILFRSLVVSFASESRNKENVAYVEWSEETLELVLCRDLKGMDSDGLCDQYSIPDALPDPAECAELTRETYCKIWHDILFTEEQHVQREIARYDIQNDEMKIINSFQNSSDETVFAQPGELFGEIYLWDYLLPDEVAGLIINRSVMSIMLRLKFGQSCSSRAYECEIKLKTLQSVIIKLNEVLCREYVFDKDEVVCIDLKFRYNHLPMCEMHQAMDMCQQKTEILLPNIKNVSYKHKKSMPDWFMDRKPNTNQHEAIAMILDPSPTPPILVIGPFGTGKTFTLNLACVSILSQSERNKVLICTHSNSAADIHLQHLDTKIRNKPSLHIRALRVLNIFRRIQTVAENLRRYCLIEEATNVIRKPTWEEICDRNVIITTLATARMLWKFYQDGRLHFTHILIDEAAQALEPECVIPLVMADGNTKIVLAGDHKQMGPVAYSEWLWPEHLGPKRSLLERLFTHYEQHKSTSSQQSPSSETSGSFLQTPYVVLLTENYRCHAKILEFSSDSFYGGELVARGNQDTHESLPVLSFYTVRGEDKQVERSLAYYNEAEVVEVVKRVEGLIDVWPAGWGKKDIGILAPYYDQVRRIREGLRGKNLHFVDVETVENAQGKEFKALFISTVRTGWTCLGIERRNAEFNCDLAELDFGFLSNPRFLNSALTRAQSLFAVVGEPFSLCSIGACKDLWRDYLKRCDTNKGLNGSTLNDVMDFCLSSRLHYPQPLNAPREATVSRDDRIIDKFVEACRETRRNDEVQSQSEPDENFPSLDDVATTASAPRSPHAYFSRKFSESVKDLKPPQLGFSFQASEDTYRMMGGSALLRENGENQVDHDIDMYSPEQLLKMIEDNPTSYIKCTFRVDTSGKQSRYCGQVPAPDSPDIQIPGRVDGVYEDDIVVLELQPSFVVPGKQGEEEVIRFGCIRGVLRSLIKPEGRKFVCKVDKRDHSVMVPINKSSPKLKIENTGIVDQLQMKGYQEALVGERVFVVKYKQWLPKFHYPLGQAISHMPHGKDFGTGMKVLYEEHNIRREFRKELIKSVAEKFGENWEVPDNESRRPAYRDSVFTVDPPESTDLDDAVSVRSLGNGNYTLQVHIADVSYFVQPATELDKEARLRGTSYYPPEENVPMLPRELSERCCSLIPGKDRLAVTVSFEVTSRGIVVGDGSIERSVICSSSRFTYLDAQKVIDATRQQEFPITDEERQIPVREAITIAHRVAQGHRRSRLGAQRSLNHRKRDDCDDNDHGNEREAHQMIEEIMIMANHLVAKYLLKECPEYAPLRVQPPPKSRRVVEWRRRFKKLMHVSIGLHWLEDTEEAHKETSELKVPFKTWCMIMKNVNRDSDYQQLARLVCDVDLFPQLSLANSRQQQLQPRGRYISSGEKFQDTSFLMSKNEAPTQVDDADVPPDDVLPSEITRTPEEDSSDDETNFDIPASSSVNEGGHCSANDRSPRHLKNAIFYGHSSLRLNAYCHFTSPIRRYIDIIVHRMVIDAQYGITSGVDPNNITEICDRCTFIARSSSRFNNETKKLQLAVNLQGTNRLVSAYIEEVTRDALKLFFGTGEFEHFPSTPVPIGRLRPEEDPDEVVDSVTLQWSFRFLRLDKHKHAQPKLEISEDENTKLQRQKEDKDASNSSDNDFDYTVSGDLWNKVLKAIKDEDEHELRSSLQEVDEDIQQRGKPKSSIQVRQRSQNDPKTSSSSPCEHENDDEPYPKEAEKDEFLEVVRYFEPYDRVKVQMRCQMNQGVLSPSIQLFEIANKIFACVEHRSSSTACFAKIPQRGPKDTRLGDIRDYVRAWKPVLMLEIVTSAVHEDDFATLSNLRVSFARDFEGLVTMEFILSKNYAKNHFLTPLDLNLMCVRVKDPDGSGKGSGYWVGHFQISEELRKRKEAMEEAENLQSANADEEENEISDSKKFHPVLARFMHSSTPIPESFIEQRFCYVTAEMIFLSSPNRRCFDALINSIRASELITSICTEQELPRVVVDVERSLPRELSLSGVHPDFHPLNPYQRKAVQKALSRSFTPIQGPPGTGKTVTGVHIAYWFAHLNRKRKPAIGEDGTKSTGAMVFYCGPSNKSVDVVARFLKKIPGLKILRMYGKEIEQKVFPVPDKINQFRSKRVSAQLKDDEELKEVSLHHVIRSAECVKFAEELKKYDDEFKAWKRNDCSTCAKELQKKIKEFKKIESEAEKWAITQNGVDVVLTTCTTAYGRRILDVCENIVSQCIIDECGMCIEAETLCAMLASKPEQVVLIGDHKQLRPVIRCKEARELGLGISMFERFSKQAHMLKIQYRMHENLCEFPSMYFYNGALETADDVRDRQPDNVTWPNGDSYPFAFYHVEGVEETLIVTTDQGNQNSKKNQKEIEKVIYLAQSLRDQGIKVEDISILSPYRAQCFEITEKLKTVGLGEISVTSVVAAQGSEKNYVILSLVRSLPEREIENRASRPWLTENLGFLTDEHQVNVALTRAKRGLCIVGNANLMGVCKVWKALLNHYEQKRCFVDED